VSSRAVGLLKARDKTKKIACKTSHVVTLIPDGRLQVIDGAVGAGSTGAAIGEALVDVGLIGGVPSVDARRLLYRLLAKQMLNALHDFSLQTFPLQQFSFHSCL
jgi:hypothetical protein